VDRAVEELIAATARAEARHGSPLTRAAWVAAVLLRQKLREEAQTETDERLDASSPYPFGAGAELARRGFQPGSRHGVTRQQP
jgi:hypothetical protein